MKKLLMFSVLVFSVAQVWAQDELVEIQQKASQEDRKFRIPLIGEAAPSFTAESTKGIVNFPADYGRKWKILFSHPQDFTPVCSSELLELANLQGEFDKLGVKLVVISTDQLETHSQWIKALQSLDYKGRAPVNIKFPLVGDDKLVVSKKYGMIHSATNSTKDVRGVFIIDPDDIIRAFYFYPMNVGRNTEELLRTVSALQATAQGGLATPADWKSGDDILVTVHPKYTDESLKALPDNYYQLSWFMMYKKPDSK
jgi:peroxiredoxin 2/4